jgi:ATP-binding cassette, subfamily F, member 3
LFDCDFILEDVMSILNVNNLGLSFGAFDVFRGISFSVAANQKIGLIGPNGIGKTSLLLILAGISLPSTGQVSLARGRRLGYLRQEAMDAFANKENTVYSEMLTVFAGLGLQQQELHALEEQMALAYTNELLETYGALQERFERAGGYDYELRIQQTLQGLGLGEDFWDSPLSQLSGGEKTRALLARLLLEKPDLLLLDEPTNHLDVDAVAWLENTLQGWEGAVLIVSHDRFFLETSVDAIWEMNRTGIEVYAGGYSDYLLQREERWEYLERAFKEEKARLLKEVDFIQRNWVRASTHARALGRLRLLTRDLAIIENYGILALRNGPLSGKMRWSETGLSTNGGPLDVVEAVRRVNSLSLNNPRPPHPRPNMTSRRPGSNIVLRIDEADIGYPGNRLFHVQNVELRRSECAALIGPNGSGKTTFLKTLLRKITTLSGEVRIGAGMQVGYFAQVHDMLDDVLSVLDELQRHKAMDEGQARSYLARYLFQGEEVFKPVSALSGGERARLALAILALDGANFLLLDEPTNHLDLAAQEALQEVLEEFSGTILIVSHDRYLIDRLATQIWELRDDALVVFKGNYRQFMLQREISTSAAANRSAILLRRPLFKVDGREARKRQESLTLLEDRIHEQEIAVRRLTQELQKAGKAQSYEQMNYLSQQIAKAQASLENLLEEWEQIAV